MRVQAGSPHHNDGSESVLDGLNRLILNVMDALLGWTLSLPRDAALIALAVGTGLLMVLIRKYTTNQDLLRRVAADKRRLGELIREAKARGDKEAVARHRSTSNLIAQKGMRQEGWPLFFALLPMIMLTTWMWQRVAYVPPRPGEACVLRAEFPVSSAGRLVHLAPVDGVRANDGWVKAIETGAAESDAASAQWTVTAEPGPHVLTVRHQGRSYEHPVVLDGKSYGEPIREHDSRLRRTELKLQPYKLFGVVPGIERLGIDPWMVAYLLIAILAVPVLKRVLRVS